jgi:hypothetical protein
MNIILIVSVLSLLSLLIITIVIIYKYRKRCLTKSANTYVATNTYDSTNYDSTNVISSGPSGRNYNYWTNYHSCLKGDSSNQPGGYPFNPLNVSKDQNDDIKLTLKDEGNGKWSAAEAVLLQTLNYGDYWFTVDYSGVHEIGANPENLKQGSKYPYSEPNVVSGIYTFRFIESDNTRADPTAYKRFCWPNACSELDIMEWGKLGVPSNPGPGDWGVQPWYKCENNPVKSMDDCICDAGCNTLDTNNIQRIEDKSVQWDNNKTKNCITYHCFWGDPDGSNPVIKWDANPGDFGEQPWNSYPTTPLWSWSRDNKKGGLYSVYLNEDIRMHFNLWAQGAPKYPGSKSIVIKNIYIPSNSKPLSPGCGTGLGDQTYGCVNGKCSTNNGSSTYSECKKNCSSSSSSSSPCENIGKFCGIWDSLDKGIDKGFSKICSSVKGCIPNCDCPKPNYVKNIACDPNQPPCDLSNQCDRVGNAWDLLGTTKSNMDSCYDKIYEKNYDISFGHTILPELSTCTDSNIQDMSSELITYSKRLSEENGVRINRLFDQHNCPNK